MISKLQPATAADAVNLADLHRQCFDPAWNESAFANLLRDGCNFGFLAGRGVSARFEAFAIARVVADEGEILSLGTLPEARRHGLAGLLVERVIHETGVRGGRRLLLEVAEDNRAALELYQSLGFSRVGTRNAYYSSAIKPPASALILRRDLDPPG